MKPHKILIASVLKPADDIRMAWKIGKSIAKIENTEVHIAGFTQKVQHIEGLVLHPLFNFGRLSFSRALANAKILKLALKLKPSIFILATHELLPAALLIKLLCGSRVIYDVQENYYRNIRFTDAFPKAVRNPLAGSVRALEKASARFIDYFLLAEKTYFNELPFVQAKSVVIENKYMGAQPAAIENLLPVTLADKSEIRLLYSGTIAANYGIMEAINLAVKLHQSDNRYGLTIIGFAAQPQVLAKVKAAIKGKDFIQLIGGDKLVPHALIIDAIRQANVGLLPYHPNPSTDHCIPTKLYEYLAHRLPMLVQQNPVWQELTDRWKAGLRIDFQNADIHKIHALLTTSNFYTKGQPTDIYWQEEEEKLLLVVKNQLLNQK